MNTKTTIEHDSENWQALYRLETGSGDKYSNKCPPAAHLAALAAGRIGLWRHRRLTAHLAACAACADDFHVLIEAQPGLHEAFAAYLAAQKPALANLIAEGWGRNRDWPAAFFRPLSLAAGSAFVLLLALVFVSVPPQGPGAMSPIAGRTLSGGDLILANDFEHAFVVDRIDRLFSSDFDFPAASATALFKDDFGG